MRTDSLKLSWSRSLPLILQTESAECGLACLAMIAGYLGYETDLASLRRKHAISQRGTNLNDLMGIASGMQLLTRPIRIELDDLSHIRTPCILHWNLNHFVVLKSSKAKQDGSLDHIVIHDPARGEQKLKRELVSNSFTGVAMELHPTAQFERKTEKQTISLSELLGKVRGLKSGLAQIFLLALALEVFALIAPFYMQWVVDSAILSADKNLLLLLALGFAGLLAFHAILGFFRSWMLLYLSSTLSLQWMNNVFHHLLRLPMQYFEKRHLGDVISRFFSIQVIQRTVTTSFVEALIDGILAITVLIAMLYYSAKLTIVVLISISVYLFLRIGMYQRFRVANEEQISLQAKEQSVFLESIRAIQAIKLFNSENERRMKWANSLTAAMNRSIHTQKMTLAFATTNKLISGLENILIIYLGAQMVMENLFSVGMLYAFVAYRGTLTTRLYAFIDKVLDYKMLSLQTDRLADILLTEPESNLPPDFKNINAPIATAISIELANVSFRYSETEPWVVRNINLKVEAGESLAIIGASGCGKTTMLKLMLGLLKPNEGEIFVNGVPLLQFGVQNYRSSIGVVMQDDCLLSGSIAENICFFAQQTDLQRMSECARYAALEQDVLAMPMRYETLIGDMGTSLSGGQKQRLLLARALYKQPKVLFLDEATSHLDVLREKEINQAVNQLKMTRVIIAHRVETILSAQRLVELKSGVIIRDFKNAAATREAEN